MKKRPLHDMVGKTFGVLKVLAFECYVEKKGVLWKCLCECGTEKLCTTASLNLGTSYSCGCCNSNSILVNYQGRRMRASEASRLSGLGYHTILRRLKCGWSEDEIFSTRALEKGCYIHKVKHAQRGKKYTYQGESRTMRGWSEEYGLEPHVVYHRLKYGWSMHKALNTPKQKKCFTYRVKPNGSEHIGLD